MHSAHGTDSLRSLSTKYPGGDSQWVDAHIQQGTPTLPWVIHTLLRLWHRSDELTMEVLDIPNDTTVDDLSQPAHSMCVAECIQSLGIMQQERQPAQKR